MDTLADYFKPQARSQGETDYRKDAVHVSQSGDTLARLFVRSGGQAKVTLSADEAGGRELKAECTCTAGKSGLLCRHVWASILKLEETESDLLIGKDSVTAGERTVLVKEKPAFQIRQEEFKEKQRERLKERNSKIKEARRAAKTASPSFPEEISQALTYFEQNGFDLSKALDSQSLDTAKRQLARVFHPDKGGSHEEILELNRQFEVLSGYLGS